MTLLLLLVTIFTSAYLLCNLFNIQKQRFSAKNHPATLRCCCFVQREQLCFVYLILWGILIRCSSDKQLCLGATFCVWGS